MRVLLLGALLLLHSLAFGAQEPYIQWFYNLPPNDHPEELGLRSQFVRQIDLAQDTVEGSFYQINDPFVVRAFVRAVNRGVRVVLTTDSDWVDHKAYRAAYRLLRAGGVKLIPDEMRHLNHNKYCIIDRDVSRARVWVGSYNATIQGSNENGNAAFLIRSPRVAEIFYADFKQMARGRFQREKGGVFLVDDEVTVVRDTVSPRGFDYRDFKSIKGKIEYPSVKIAGTKIEIYFSPRHNIQKKVVEAIYSAKESIHFATYSLDNPMIYQALMNKANTYEINSDYNIYPVALRQDPWQKLTKKLRIFKSREDSFIDELFSDKKWKAWNEDNPDLFGEEHLGLFYNAARYFYPPGKVGGEIKKVDVYGAFNWLGLSKGPYADMLEKGLMVRKTAMPGNLHHKFIMIDKRILILGSYNFSSTAEKKNDETAIIIRNPKMVEDFYESVYRSAYMNAYPEYTPGDEELEEFSYNRKSIVLSEIHFTPKRGFTQSKFVELRNYATCRTERECDKKTVRMKGWKFWNGIIPMHNVVKMRGSTDTLVSYFNDPYTNKHGANHKKKGYFLFPGLETLRPGEYGLIVSREFDLTYLDPYLKKYAKQFETIYGRAPKTKYEKYPKLFVSSRPNDSTLGAGLRPYQFLTLYYPDKFTMADRFEFNADFRDKKRSSAQDYDDLIGGETDLVLALKKGQSLERVSFDEDEYDSDYDTYEETYDGDYRLLYHGLKSYGEAAEWKANSLGRATPGYGHKE